MLYEFVSSDSVSHKSICEIGFFNSNRKRDIIGLSTFSADFILLVVE